MQFTRDRPWKVKLHPSFLPCPPLPCPHVNSLGHMLSFPWTVMLLYAFHVMMHLNCEPKSIFPPLSCSVGQIKAMRKEQIHVTKRDRWSLPFYNHNRFIHLSMHLSILDLTAPCDQSLASKYYGPAMTGLVLFLQEASLTPTEATRSSPHSWNMAPRA